MIPGFGKIDPKKMQSMMKQLGISQEEIDCSMIIIKKRDNSKIIIENPSVIKMKIQNQDIIQISGGKKIEESSENIDKDIQTIVEKTGCTREQAKKALEETGDLAEAILKLS